MRNKKHRSALRLPSVPIEIRKLLGPPPLLSSEDEKFYYAMLAHFGASVEGTDLMTWLLLKDVADARAAISRYRRFKTLRIAISREAEKQKTLNEFGREKKRELYRNNIELHKQAVAKSDVSDEEKQRKSAEWDQVLVDATAHMEAEYAKLVKQLRTPNTDRDYMGVFRRWIEDHEKLDLLQQAEEDRFKAALAELDRYQRGRFESLKKELDIIEGEIIHPKSEVEAARCQQLSERRRISHQKHRARTAVRPAATSGPQQEPKKAEGDGRG